MDHVLTAILTLIFLFLHSCHCTYDCIKLCACEKRDGLIIADCRGLNFTEVPQPNPHYQVNVLYLRYNRISRLRMGDFVMYSHLKELQLQGNRMDSIGAGAFDGLEKLERLDISMNSLKKIPESEIQKLANIEVFSASMNALRVIPSGIATRPRLQELDLSNNIFISDIPSGSLPKSLVKLDLHSTRVRNFKKSTFEGLTSLKTLLLSDNGASSSVRFDGAAFSELVSLEYLDLSRCYCKNLPRESFTALANLSSLLLNNCWLDRLPAFARTNFGNNGLERKRRSNSNVDSAKASTESPLTTSMPASTTAAPQTTPAVTTAPSPGDIWYNPKLTLLDLSNNRQLDIAAQSVRLPSSLLELRLGNTIISTIDDELFNETIQIQKLDVCNSKITSISADAFMKFRNISEICLSGNPLALAPKLPTSLRYLNLSETSITNLTLGIMDGLTHVVEANIKNGNIEWIGDDAFRSMTSLRVLNLSDNRIDTIGTNSLRIGVFEYNFAGNRLFETPRGRRRYTGVDGMGSYLTDLDLSDNIIRIIERGAFATHTRLLKLNLQGNFLSSIQLDLFAGLSHLTKLDVSNNLLTSIVPKAFADLTNLQVLDLGDNLLEDILEGTFNGLSSLKSLNLARNRIVIFHPFATHSLEYLDISKNNLTLFPKLSGPSVRNISASGNAFVTLAANLEGLPRLQSLDLSECGIVHMNYSVFHSTPDLRSLVLSGNYITEFLHGWFPSLEVLSLEENEILAIDSDLAEVTPKLQRMYIQYNNITYIDPKNFAHSALVEIDMIGNDLQCDCRLLPLVQWIDKNLESGDVNVLDAESYTCAGPPILYADPVLDAVAALNCDNPQPATPDNKDMFVGIGIATLLFVTVFILLLWAFFVGPRSRRRRSENGAPMMDENGGREVVVAKKGCCAPCKQWWLGMSYKTNRGHRDRIVSDERRDLMVASPVSSPTETAPPETL